MCTHVKGGISVAVLGEVAGYYEAWKLFGRLSWQRLVQPTIDMCRSGYHVQWSLAHALKEKEKVIRQTPSLRYICDYQRCCQFIVLNI